MIPIVVTLFAVIAVLIMLTLRSKRPAPEGIRVPLGTDEQWVRRIQRMMIDQFFEFRSWTVHRSGTTLPEMEANLRQELQRTLQHLPEELETYGEPVIEQLEHIPGKTYDGKITIKLRHKSESGPEIA